MARQQVNTRLPAVTVQQIADLVEGGYESQSAVVAAAIDRLWVQVNPQPTEYVVVAAHGQGSAISRYYEVGGPYSTEQLARVRARQYSATADHNDGWNAYVGVAEANDAQSPTWIVGDDERDEMDTLAEPRETGAPYVVVELNVHNPFNAAWVPVTDQTYPTRQDAELAAIRCWEEAAISGDEYERIGVAKSDNVQADVIVVRPNP